MQIAAIQKAVASDFGVPIGSMISKDRSRIYAWPRMIAMELTRELTARSLPEIGRCFGGRDHTTVLSAIRRVQRLEFLRENAARIKAKLLAQNTVSWRLGFRAELIAVDAIVHAIRLAFNPEYWAEWTVYPQCESPAETDGFELETEITERDHIIAAADRQLGLYERGWVRFHIEEIGESRWRLSRVQQAQVAA